MVLKQFCNDWVGVPFLHGGRDKSGVDCYGLAIEYFKLKGIETPDFQYPEKWSKDGNNLFMENIEKFPNLFEGTERGQKGDIVLFTGINGIVDHIGILISSEKFLHSVRNIGVVISPFNQLYSRKLYGFYRIKCEKQSK